MFVKTISAGLGLQVLGDSAGYVPESGTLMWDSVGQKVIVARGDTFSTVYPQNVIINLSPEIQAVLAWAQKHMEREKGLIEAAKSSEAVREAIEHLDLLMALSKKDKENQ